MSVGHLQVESVDAAPLITSLVLGTKSSVNTCLAVPLTTSRPIPSIQFSTRRALATSR
jgi:hypothetical protein